MNKDRIILSVSLLGSIFLLANTVAALRLPEQDISQHVASDSPVRSTRSLASYSGIVKRNPFAIAGSEKKKALASLPRVSKVFRLVGTIASRDGGSGIAIIEKKGGKQGVFSKGDTVFGARLVEVRDKAVVLRRNNRLEVLAMDADALVTKVKKKAKAGAALPVSSLSGSINRKEVLTILKSPDKLAREIVLLPGKRSGKSGVFVQNIKKDGLLSSSGLKKGDLLLTANGEPLSLRGGASELRSLLSEQQVSIILLRGTEKKTLELAFF